MASSFTKVPGWYWLVAALALIWNLMGVAAYLVHVEVIDLGVHMSAEEQALVERTPPWITGVYAIAVFAGTFGALSLLIRNRLARPLFMLSLIAVLIQEIWVIFVSEARQVYGTMGIILPIVTTAIALLLYWFADKAVKRGWIP